ncbi:transporter substrate-binding domain-containing protein [Desulfobacterales bacterium HSG16]|nr:transporter substrate-binding domain-containing protein [Desulfobacterales bacterium HSG16]
MKKKTAGLALVIYFVVFSFSTAKADELKVGVLNFPPFYMYEKGKEIGGSMFELLKKILDHIGVQYKIAGYPPPRLFNNLKNGDTNIFMGIKGIEAYDKDVLYSDMATEQIDVRVFTRGDVPMPQDINGLKGKTIITIRGYSYGGIITFLKDPANEITLDPTSKHILAFRKLQHKRADYLLDYKGPADNVLQTFSKSDIQEHSIMRIDVYIIISKKTPNASELMRRMEKAYTELK